MRETDLSRQGDRCAGKRPAGPTTFSCVRILTAAAVMVAVWAPAWSQSLEPRAYANTPIGMNFLIVGYGYSSGDVALDPSAPLDDAEMTLNAGLASYVRSIAVAGQSGKIVFVLPYAGLSGSAIPAGGGPRVTRNVSGLGDPSFRFSVNILGAPALSARDFRTYKQGTIVGVGLLITAPLGQYDADRLVNLGTNRWSFKPEIGISRAVGRWTVEGVLAANFFTDNDEFFGGVEREQDPLYAVQGHVIRSFKGGTWASFDATYYAGGQTTVDGVAADDELKNWRIGATVVLPINRQHSIKLFLSDGASRRGADYSVLGVAWQLRWGGGMPKSPGAAPPAAPPPSPG